MDIPKQQQQPPGHEAELTPQADHGETSYRGSGRLQDKATVITGGDSGTDAPAPARAPMS